MLKRTKCKKCPRECLGFKYTTGTSKKNNAGNWRYIVMFSYKKLSSGPGHDSKVELISINNQQQVKSFQGAFKTKLLFVKAIEMRAAFCPVLYKTRELRCMTEGLYCWSNEPNVARRWCNWRKVSLLLCFILDKVVLISRNHNTCLSW